MDEKRAVGGAGDQDAPRAVPRSLRIFRELSQQDNLIDQMIGSACVDVLEEAITARTGAVLLNATRAKIQQIKTGARCELPGLAADNRRAAAEAERARVEEQLRAKRREEAELQRRLEDLTAASSAVVA